MPINHEDPRDDVPMCARHVNALGKLTAEFKTNLTEDAARDLRIYFAKLGMDVSQGLRNDIWFKLYGESFDDAEAREDAHKRDLVRASLGVKGILAADKQPSNLRAVAGGPNV